MTVRIYPSPEAFKQALEQKIKDAAALRGMTINRVRQLFITERFLVRALDSFGPQLVAKGGLVLELRLARARTTKDLDLRLTGDPENLLRRLRDAAATPTPDLLEFVVEADLHHPTMDGDGIVYQGHRFTASARLAGRPYGGAFGVDVGVGDVLTEDSDVVHGSSLLTFVGVDPPPLRVYPRVAHVAEKLHAYTLPRERPNSRVKDLPDIALLATSGPFEGRALRAALDATFTFRKTHALPNALPPPPAEWARRYEAIARDDGLPWSTLADVFDAARGFLDPVLAGDAGTWNYDNHLWV